MPAHHQKTVQTNCETLGPILSTCRPRLRMAEAGTSTQTRRSLAPVVTALLHLSSFLLVQLAIMQVPAVPPELIAQHPLLGLRLFALSGSTQSCQQGSVAFPSFFNSFSTSRADHGTSFTRQTTQHQSLHRGSATIDEFSQLKCCGSCDVPFSGTRTE